MSDDGKIRTYMMLYFQLFDQSNVLYHISAYSDPLIRWNYSRTSDWLKAFPICLHRQKQGTGLEPISVIWIDYCSTNWTTPAWTLMQIEMTGFEPATSCSQSKCHTWLDYISISHNFLHVESARFYLTFFKWPTWPIAFHTIVTFGREFFGSPRIL